MRREIKTKGIKSSVIDGLKRERGRERKREKEKKRNVRAVRRKY